MIVAADTTTRDQPPGGNPGSQMMLDGVTVRVVYAIHSTGVPRPTITAPYGGIATGFVITFENGWTVHFTGSSVATQDQAIWGERYKPDAVNFHMSRDKEPLDAIMEPVRSRVYTFTGWPTRTSASLSRVISSTQAELCLAPEPPLAAAP